MNHKDADKLVKKIKKSDFSIILSCLDNSQYRIVDYSIIDCKNINVIKYIIDNTPDIDTVYSDGSTTLDMALGIEANDNIIEHILDKSMNFNIFLKNSGPYNTFDNILVAGYKNKNIYDKIAVLAKNHIDDYGKIKDISIGGHFLPIHLACSWGSLELVDLLHNTGTSLESLSGDNETCIFFAISNRDVKVAKYMLDKNVNLLHRDIRGNSIICEMHESDMLHENIDVQNDIIKKYVEQLNNQNN